jgi:hypothetical protein
MANLVSRREGGFREKTQPMGGTCLLCEIFEFYAMRFQVLMLYNKQEENEPTGIK